MIPITRRMALLVTTAALLPLLSLVRVRASSARPVAPVEPMDSARLKWWHERALLDGWPALPGEDARAAWTRYQRERPRYEMFRTMV